MSAISDEQARLQAVDPGRNVVLEASAGTGKTRVLVDRYLNLLRAGVDPANILAITYTRKAAAEMRARILAKLREQAVQSAEGEALWRTIRERSGDVAISTIDAFCLSLLREFPLEADLDPGFEMVDDTEVPRLVEEALDQTLRIGLDLARRDEFVRLVFAQLGEWRLREGLTSLLERRLVAEDALERALELGPRDLTAEVACRRAFHRLRELFGDIPGGLENFLRCGPGGPRYDVVAEDLRLVCGQASAPSDLGLARAVLDRIDTHFLKNGRPREGFGTLYPSAERASPGGRHDRKRHLEIIRSIGPMVADALAGFQRDLNAVLSRGVGHIHRIALSQYRRTLETHAVLDFPEVLKRAVDLLEQMEEFARSRYRLEARYHHVLLDEFQDTSRAQWNLVALLIRSWGEGMGVSEQAPLPPTIFLVGDRKQSIYGFRDADVAVMEDARGFVDRLRPDGNTRRAISRSFRSAPALLAFFNDLFDAVEREPSRRDAFRYDEQDRFPTSASPPGSGAGTDALGVVAAPSLAGCAQGVAGEIERLLESQETVRDPATAEVRPVRPGDIAILFRTRDSHREFEKALDARSIATYVYKGLGFFEADEIQDAVALLRYLAAPASDLRAAAFLRSRFVRLSDAALHILAPGLASALTEPTRPEAFDRLDGEDRRVLEHARSAVSGWLALVDRLPPAELLEQLLDESAYLYEIRGTHAVQARENLKKFRALIRRVQNRGYSTLGRVAEHLDRLWAGDESNAVIDAVNAVNLMTVHAAKGLEFPIIFVVNLTRGTANRRAPIRVGADPETGEPWVSVGAFQSDADIDAKNRDREETKRLLYVAVTRARDRLYLSSEVKEGGWKPGGGSLADVLPKSFKAVFETAAAGPTAQVEWPGAGRQHVFRVCSHAGSNRLRQGYGSLDPPVRPVNFAPLEDPKAMPRIPVTGLTASTSTGRPEDIREVDVGTFDQTLVGTLVHRLFEHAGATGGRFLEPEAVAKRIQLLVRDEETAESEDLDEVLRQASGAYLALCAQPSVSAALEHGESWFEVPFSVRLSGSRTVLRGTFDCLVRSADSRITILELKTGRPSPRHREQLDIYLSAARALFPEAVVDGSLVYSRRVMAE